MTLVILWTFIDLSVSSCSPPVIKCLQATKCVCRAAHTPIIQLMTLRYEKYSCFLQKSVQTVSVSPHISLIYRPNNTRWDVRWCSCLPEPPASLNLLISCLLPLVWPPHLPLVFTRCTCTDRTVDQVCRVLVIKICIPLCEPCKHTRSVSRTSSCNWDSSDGESW